ncbi:MAG TPA: hypothetical protein VFS75_03715, partial [Candidatus Paceibacterota bacterium]|nr:hypothetical protein [Candidatus Paceibacterota bacterium]
MDTETVTVFEPKLHALVDERTMRRLMDLYLEEHSANRAFIEIATVLGERRHYTAVGIMLLMVETYVFTANVAWALLLPLTAVLFYLAILDRYAKGPAFWYIREKARFMIPSYVHEADSRFGIEHKNKSWEIMELCRNGELLAGV